MKAGDEHGNQIQCGGVPVPAGSLKNLENIVLEGYVPANS